MKGWAKESELVLYCIFFFSNCFQQGKLGDFPQSLQQSVERLTSESKQTVYVHIQQTKQSSFGIVLATWQTTIKITIFIILFFLFWSPFKLLGKYLAAKYYWHLTANFVFLMPGAGQWGFGLHHMNKKIQLLHLELQYKKQTLWQTTLHCHIRCCYFGLVV